MTCENIWDKFKMKNMGDYHNHFFKKDVLLSADIFEKFIDTCLKYYGFDPLKRNHSKKHNLETYKIDKIS